MSAAGGGETGPADKPLTYLQAFRLFGRNARLYLAYATMSGINSTIFVVAFAFYLEEAFSPGVSILGIQMGAFYFIGLALSAQAIAHGISSLPAGFIGDKYGRKRSFIAASLVAIFAGVAILVTVNPLLEGGGFWSAFLLGGVLYFAHALLWFLWFNNHPADNAWRAIKGAIHPE